MTNSPAQEKEYTREQAVSSACHRAARDRAGTFTVYSDKFGFVVQDSKAVAPRDSKIDCMVQFWSDRDETDDLVTVQIRESRATSTFREVTISAP